MLQVVLCDDDPMDVQAYAGQIGACAKKNQIEIQLSCFTSAEALLCEMCEFKQQVDILYLDIIMDKTNGMEAAQTLRDFGSYAQIVFLTRCADYMPQAFDVHAVQYLLKGQTTDSQFEQVFLRAVKQVNLQKEELFICEFNSVMTSIPFRLITFFEVMNREILLHHTESKDPIRFYGIMGQLEADLASKNFLRIHRSYLVHLPYIAKFGKRMLMLKNKTELPIGGIYMDKVKRAFSDYISRNHIYYP